MRRFSNRSNEPALVEPGRHTRDPFYVRHVAENTGDCEERAMVKHVCGADPSHELTRCLGKTLVDRIVHSVIGFADPPEKTAFVLAYDLDGPVRGPPVYNHILQAW